MAEEQLQEVDVKIKYFGAAGCGPCKTFKPIIKKLQRISKPGLRKYSSFDRMPRVLNGLGISIVSTSKGLMTGKQANRENVGGELLCYIY